MTELEERVEELWAEASSVTPDNAAAAATVNEAIELLDTGAARIAEWNADGTVTVHQWLKHAVMLLFKTTAMETMDVGPFEFADKLPLKRNYHANGVRVVPGALARWGSYIAPSVILMPSFVNIGAYVDEGTMVDTWATVGSCAQIGKNVHLSGGVGIGGVLEPAQAAPVMIGDEAFIGSRCMVTSGARVGEGAVLGSGVILNDSIPVIDAQSGDEISRGEVPAWSVAVLATRPREFDGGTFGLPCALVIKRLDEGERHDKTVLNTLLRDHGVAV